jgi:hypothetical protein
MTRSNHSRRGSKTCGSQGTRNGDGGKFYRRTQFKGTRQENRFRLRKGMEPTGLLPPKTPGGRRFVGHMEGRD